MKRSSLSLQYEVFSKQNHRILRRPVCARDLMRVTRAPQIFLQGVCHQSCSHRGNSFSVSWAKDGNRSPVQATWQS
jgi:hypothetical protein